jgi:formate dehydrogenase gamma subunit
MTPEPAQLELSHGLLDLRREIGPYSSCRCPRRYDIEWLKRGGGMIGPHQPPAHRFSAGQKLVYWIVVLGGGAVAVSGYLLIFPFYGTTIETMQRAEMVHSIVAMLFIAVKLGHIYRSVWRARSKPWAQAPSMSTAAG